MSSDSPQVAPPPSPAEQESQLNRESAPIVPTATSGVEKSFLEAIYDAMAEEMEADDRVFVFGEDVGHYGGAFKVTKGLLERFGPKRVIDTPISESAIVGAATGAAIMGMRPIAEMQYVDFITCAFDQLVTETAKMRFRTGHGVPMVLRAASGAGVRAGPFHSGQPEAFFAHSPGLKIVIPGDPYDAKGLLKAAIRDDDPVLFFESKYLYRRLTALIPEGDYIVPLGEASVKREGSDVVCITYGAQVSTALSAAAALESEGISLEVLDLRSVVPLDQEKILESVAKCSRVVICHEANPVCSISSEVAAIIAEKGFDLLDAPLRRVTSPQAPVPFAAVLEDAYVPSADDIVAAVREIAAW